jgi:REP element-mobilizing transposase RayT
MSTSIPGVPMAYHISFTCYGNRLHGDEKGSVDRKMKINPDTPFIGSDKIINDFEYALLSQPPYILDKPRRHVVLNTIIEVCKYRGWFLWALHVRSTHVHAVVSAQVNPEKILGEFKAYSSRRLNEAGFENKDRKRLQRHGSTKYKWDEDALNTAIEYVVLGQGEPMEVYWHNCGEE